MENRLTHLIEIVLALDCVVLAAMFYLPWREQRAYDKSHESSIDLWLAQEGGSCLPTDINSRTAESGTRVAASAVHLRKEMI